MARAKTNGIEIEYDRYGNPADPMILLIMGFTMQKQAWDERFCNMLVERGFQVARFDNRDVGLSSKIDDGPFPNIPAIMMGDPSSVAYSLDDMARDTVGLLDAMDVARAHIVGVSMGGMIAQLVSILFGSRVRSLTSIMSTTGDRSVGSATPEALSALMTPPPTDRAGYIERGVEIARIIGSRSLPAPADVVRAHAAEAYDRAFFPLGGARQFAAILSAHDRTEALHQVKVPTLVLHGAEDPLIAPDGGEATARAIPGARFERIEKMGHDLPEPLWPQITALIAEHASAH